MEYISESTNSIPSLNRHNNRFARRAAASKLARQGISQRVRRAAKQHASDYAASGDVCKNLGIACPSGPNGCLHLKGVRREDRSRLRPHIETALWYIESDARLRRELRENLHHGHTRSFRGRDVCDGEDLARSKVALPSDRFRFMVRQPSLTREDAFCDADTFKGKVHVRRAPPMPVDDDAQVAELYRMGLLYDEADSSQDGQAPSFNLNNIHHDEPIYSIRPSRRARKLNKAMGGAGHDLPLDLNLNLSFADLGHDNDIARYLVSPSASEAADAETIQHLSRRESQRVSAPLRVVYELGTSRPSFEVDTSQPPDLIDDFLSGYDYFSDSDLDDSSQVPSQREIYDDGAAADAPSAWVMLGDDS